jgi:hypothetical protein
MLNDDLIAKARDFEPRAFTILDVTVLTPAAPGTHIEKT